MKSALLLIFTLALAVFNVITDRVQAQDFTYTTNNGTITITGYTGTNGTLTIPGTINVLPVTSIGDEAFFSCASLTNITIPNSVTNIGDYAFQTCTNLTNITISSSVIRIGGSAFCDCTSLITITVAMDNPAYSSVEGVMFDKSQTTLLVYPLAKAGSYIIPNSVTNGLFTFMRHPNLTSLTIGDGLTGIPYMAGGVGPFFSCTSLTNVTIGKSVTFIHGGALGGWDVSLTTITVDPQNPTFSSIDGVLFNKSQTALIQYPGGKDGSYTVPNSVTNIEGLAFAYSTSLTSLTVPDSVTCIGDFAFSECSNLKGLLFQGNAPSLGGTNVFSADNVTIYFLPGSVGWGSTLLDLPTAVWTLPYPTILTTPSSIDIKPTGFGFTVSWATNASVVVEASASLTNPVWSPVATNALTGGSLYFSDPQWAKYPNRFYRIRSP